MRASQYSELNRIALVGDSLPRHCGIATFTCDLCNAIGRVAKGTETVIIPVNDTEAGYDYPANVWFEVVEKELDSYRRAADFLNLNDFAVVSLQHEFGLYGGPAGAHVLTLLRELRMPVVTTLHTILHEPDSDQRRVMEGLIEYSDLLVTLSHRGGELLRAVYGVPDEKIEMIPHGIPDVPFVDPSFYKDKFGVEARPVLLTFGLIGPSKGLEYALEALPAILAEHPDTVYIILGATHPSLKRQQGEQYRVSLQRLARKLDVDRHVVFHNRFVSAKELNEFLGAADIYLTPYLNVSQVCSGALAYAVGAGKAVVSTPYWHAQELLADGRGRLVPFRNSHALAEAVTDLLSHPAEQDAMRKRAYLHMRNMTWPKAARKYLLAFARIREQRARHPQLTPLSRTRDQLSLELPLIQLDHLQRMTDDTGILQHAIYCIPNYGEGYTTDDNARALLLTVLLEDILDSGSAELPGLSRRYMAFLQYAFNEKRRRFRNFLAYDHRSWLEEVGSEDSHGRSLWALGALVARSRQPNIREWAGQLFQLGVPATREFSSPRAWAFTLLGLAEYLHAFSGDRIAEGLRDELANRLLDLYKANRSPDWMWFEPTVTYCNSRLPQALLICGRTTRNDDMVQYALESLEWLAALQTATAGHFLPIGSHGFYNRGGERARFDQQPVEAHGMVSACLEAHRTTGEARWLHEAQRAFEWFIGRNDLGCLLYDPSSGGCHDGLQPHGVNRNQGAESTLAFLLALAEMRLAEHELEPAASAHIDSTAQLELPASV